MVMMIMVTCTVEWSTVDDDLIASDDGFFQQLASVHRFICRAVFRTVGVVRAIIDDDMLAMGIELSQNSVFSMCGMRTIRVVVAMVFRLFVVSHQEFSSRMLVSQLIQGFFDGTNPGLSGVQFLTIDGGGILVGRIHTGEADIGKFAWVGGWTLRIAGRKVPFGICGKAERRIVGK